MTIPRVTSALGAAFLLCAFPPISGAAIVVVDTTGGANSNAAASGRVTDGGADVANWSLTSTVADTDWINQAATGGSAGLEYAFQNLVSNSTDRNEFAFSVSPLGDYDATGLSISQSPYDSGLGWNGGGSDNTGAFLVAEFALSWSGSGLAIITDPDDQLSTLNTGDEISSNATITFSSGQIFNNADTWSIFIPGTASATVNFGPTLPLNGRALASELISFNPQLTQVAVPVPATLLLVAGGLLGLRRFARQR